MQRRMRRGWSSPESVITVGTVLLSAALVALLLVGWRGEPWPEVAVRGACLAPILLSNAWLAVRFIGRGREEGPDEGDDRQPDPPEPPEGGDFPRIAG